VAFHGTNRETAEKLIAGVPFDVSKNDDDWLGHGVYFWEHAPHQAWWWANRRYGPDAAVVGALVRLGRCLDLLDPSNTILLKDAHRDLECALLVIGRVLQHNANNHKFRDCAVFNYLFASLKQSGVDYDSVRAVFVPTSTRGLPRLWDRSGVFSNAHIQISVRNPNSILAVWPVKRSGLYGKDDP